ncbi:MAG: hypothetical protein Q4P34_02885 [Tissierellia bacterium]|nr:hypothetical protein [Tissierellia bacterium]
MKKLTKYSILFASFLLLFYLVSGCTKIAGNIKFIGISDEIEKPENKEHLIDGTWKLKEKIVPDTIEESIREKYSDDEYLYISNDLVKFKDRFTTKPNFKTRYLNYAEFFKDKTKDENIIDNFLKREGPLLTVADGQFFYQDFIIDYEDELSFLYDGIFFVFERVDTKVSAEIIDEAKKIDKELSIKETHKADPTKDIGMTIGIRTTKKDKDTNTYSGYKTIFLRKGATTKPIIYSIRNLLLSRNSGFWLVGQEHIVETDNTRDVLFAYPLAGGNRDDSRYLLGKKNNCSILYLGSDYVSIELYDYNSDDKSYGIYDIDKLAENTKLNVKDIAGDQGLEAFRNDTAKVLSNNSVEEDMGYSYDASNIGMKRTNGRWDFRSNIIMRVDNNLIMQDYKLSLVPNIDIVKNDMLALSWESIKTRFPAAIDAYTSPDEDLLLVQNLNEILIYELNSGIISNDYLVSIKANESDRIVMTQWVSGKQTELWEQVFLKQDRIPVETLLGP